MIDMASARRKEEGSHWMAPKILVVACDVMKRYKHAVERSIVSVVV